MTDPDPVDLHVAALARRLRGPARLRRSMLAETRAGLRDAAAAHRDAAAAVAEFGSVAEIAPAYQAELTAAQGRRTALLLVALFPALVLGWDLLWSSGVAWTGPAPAAVRLLAGVQDVASWGITALAVVLLVLTLRSRADERRLALAAGGLGALGAVLCGGTAVAMNLANLRQSTAMVAGSPLALLAIVLSALALVLVLTSTARALRLAVRPDH
ncbi:HAAS signaling domain-containing protein [Pseudonocardia abyssalis]|uniref:Uncharacterized protein n=1 Tax=Pseudonocardia abyssalis TaxID=2792008 RepID=A0ABS6UUL9_9PSEU|nr:hypothetical protein [Pseudonocardia abyssalis]MBW0117522.1 hypothetical protein [Pseudonocardia abyssalis]MBW0135950.1 hypothetical protein [Pseudonocardia abyssalis]